MNKTIKIILAISGIVGLFFWIYKGTVYFKLKDMKLSKNFTLGEFINTSTGIENVPGQNEVENIKHLVTNVLQPLRDYFGKPIIITSGYRSQLVNAAIGGATNSQHSKGQAADFHIKGVTNTEIIQAILKLRLPFDQLIDEQLYRSSGRLSKWIHVSYNKAGNRKQLLKARNTIANLNTVYSPLTA